MLNYNELMAIWQTLFKPRPLGNFAYVGHQSSPQPDSISKWVQLMIHASR